MSDLLQRGGCPLPTRRRNPCVLLAQIEVLRIGVAQPRLVARLSRQPVEEPLQVRQRRVERRLAQTLASVSADLFRQSPLEGDGKLDVEGLEVPVASVSTSNRARALATPSTVVSL